MDTQLDPLSKAQFEDADLLPLTLMHPVARKKHGKQNNDMS